MADLATRLFAAVDAGDLEQVKALVNQGADVNSTAGWDNATPLENAVSHGHTEIARFLLDNGADVNAETVENVRTPLLTACTDEDNDRPQLVRLLLDRGADINFVGDLWDDTPLARACRNDLTETAQILIERGANVDGKPGESVPLVQAGNNLKIAKLLIDKGADINARDNQDNQTPLHAAACGLPGRGIGNVSVVQLLLARGADIHARDRYGNTPLHTGIIETAIAKMLLDAGADPTIRNNAGESSLDLAKSFGRYGLVRVVALIEKKLATRAAAKSMVEIGHKTQFPPEINAKMMEYLAPTTNPRTPEHQARKVHAWRAMVKAGPAIEAAHQRRREADEQAQEQETLAAMKTGGKKTRRRRTRHRKPRTLRRTLS